MKNFKSIAKRNAEFANMTKMEKRVALAKDVLDQLELRKFIPTPGTYINSFVVGYEDQERQTPIIAETCNVCALGALTVSLIDGDAFNEYGNNQVSCHDVLSKNNLWNREESYEIENVFENTYQYKDIARRNDYVEPEVRMKEIMLNIVRNNGEFKGEQLPFYF